MAMKPPSSLPIILVSPTRLAMPSMTIFEAVGSQMIEPSRRPALKLEVCTSMFWLRYCSGWMPNLRIVSCPLRSVQLPLATATRLPFHHFTASSGVLKSGASLRDRKTLHWSLARPSTATMRNSRTLCLLMATMVGMSPM
jgi:hypothetical protein